MQVLSVSVGKKRNITIGDKVETTGIYKEAMDEPVVISETGVADDHIDDKRNHGGVDQAVYVYGSVDYVWWSAELGQQLEPGTFGENLTVSDFESAEMTVGDRLYVGDTVVLEVTSPRIPCVTLASRMGDPEFIKRFRDAERPGVYCRVITPGNVQKGDAVRVEQYTGETVTMREMVRVRYDRNASEADLRRQLAAPIAIRARRSLERRLAKMAEVSK